jgi:hypothetical protein
MISQYDYYQNENVRQRLKEYLSDKDKITAKYLVAYGEHLNNFSNEPFLSVENSRFDWILDNSMDIFRSFWDDTGTLLILDIEYYNLDFGGNIYLKPKTCFEKLEPVYQIIKKIYNEYNIKHLTIMTGQGYHFSAKVKRGSDAHKMLEEIGFIPEELMGKYKSTSNRRREQVDDDLALAYDGAGKILEYVYHRILKEKKNNPNILPIHMGDIATENRGFGREGISIDLTSFSDPLFMRDIRLPFSTHQKHKVQKYKVGDEISENIPVQTTLLRIDNMSLDELLYIRRHFSLTANLAKDVNCNIPINDESIQKLIIDYKNDKLYKFHKDFDLVYHDHFTVWNNTYDKFDLNLVPICLRDAIINPNPALLKPTLIKHLTRVFTSLSWHPKHIAGFLRSKYERDYNWETNWGKYDATLRANFWIRIYYGIMYCNLDNLDDFNCSYFQNLGFCPEKFCGYDLTHYKENLNHLFNL